MEVRRWGPPVSITAPTQRRLPLSRGRPGCDPVEPSRPQSPAPLPPGLSRWSRARPHPHTHDVTPALSRGLSRDPPPAARWSDRQRHGRPPPTASFPRKWEPPFGRAAPKRSASGSQGRGAFTTILNSQSVIPAKAGTRGGPIDSTVAAQSSQPDPRSSAEPAHHLTPSTARLLPFSRGGWEGIFCVPPMRRPPQPPHPRCHPGLEPGPIPRSSPRRQVVRSTAP